MIEMSDRGSRLADTIERRPSLPRRLATVILVRLVLVQLAIIAGE